MLKRLRLTVLVDNYAHEDAYAVEHGFAVWIEADQHRILFDCGQGNALVANAKQLDVPLQSVHSIVLSHGHYDHTGGLSVFSELSCAPTVYAHPNAMKGHYRRLPEPPHKTIGMPSPSRVLFERGRLEVRWTPAPTEVVPGVWVTGEIPRLTSYEDTGGPFYQDLSCMQVDTIPDDQSLVFFTRYGLVVLLGCAHAGVINTLSYISEFARGLNFLAIIGGMHLESASDERMNQTAEALKPFNIPLIVPCHCTGEAAVRFLKQQMPSSVTPGGVGERFVF